MTASRAVSDGGTEENRAVGAVEGPSRGPRLAARDSHRQEYSQRGHLFSGQDVCSPLSHTASAVADGQPRNALTAGPREQGL